MTTVFYLIRHAQAELRAPGLLTGRSPDVALSEEGRRQASALAQRFAPVSLDAIYSSPLERALATAEALIPARLDTPVTVSEALNELDYGAWTGMTISDLDADDPRWRPYNRFRSGSRIPDGEGILDVQARVVAEMLRLHDRHGEARIALVSHADVIRAALAHWLGMPLDLLLRLRIDPASVSVVAIDEWGAEIHGVNGTGAIP